MADTNLLILAREFKALRTRVQEVLKMPVGPQGLQGEKGEQGVKGETGAPGKNGKDGKDGVNGLNGSNGINGKDGEDGKDGLDGVGVQNAYIDFDNSLVIVLTSGQEINAGFLSQETKDAVVATFKQGAATINELLPVQIGNAGKFLTTDGENTSWATVTAGSSYTNADVDAHLNTTTATTGEVLSWNGTDYDWATPPAGYSDAAVDTHLNTSTATAAQVLSWTGTDYDWVTPSSGGGSALTISNKTAAYTIVAGDLGTIINCTSGTFTVSLTAAAALGSGFNCWVWNTSVTSSDAITIDPSGVETIDGAATLILRRGEGMQIVCNGTNFQTGDKKAMRAYADNLSPTDARAIATGATSLAIGNSATASGGDSVAIGHYVTASGSRAMAFGSGAATTTASGTESLALGGRVTASASLGTAIGQNSSAGGSQAVSGSGAMALGGSYASGSNSFAAAVANNTSSYGAKGSSSIAIGNNATATTTGSVAIGNVASCTGSVSYALGNGATASGGSGCYALGISSTASANNAFSIGADSIASAASAYAVGNFATASSPNSIALGFYSRSAIYGKTATASGRFASSGDAQTGTFILRRATTDATATVLTTDNTAPGTDDQILLPNNSAYAFSGIIVARQQAAGGTQSAAWKVEGLLIRNGTAASTTLVASTVTAISNTPGWTLALSADTTNGGLAVTFTGAAATNIRTVATIQTSEVTYA